MLSHRIKVGIVFNALKFAGSRGSCLNSRPIGREFIHPPRDPANVNMYDRYSCNLLIPHRKRLKFVKNTRFVR